MNNERYHVSARVGERTDILMIGGREECELYADSIALAFSSLSGERAEIEVGPVGQLADFVRFCAW